MHWLQELNAVQRAGKRAISIAVVSTRGSVPREAGTRMLVTADEVTGTIGGGHLEFKAIDIARGILGVNGSGSLQRFPLGASLGQCCGGVVNLLFEPVAPNAAWTGQILQFRAAGQHCMAVTPARGEDGKLLVTADDRYGSLGPALYNEKIETIARQRLAANEMSTLLMVGDSEYFFERISAPDFNIMLFGAGHVGHALVQILSALPCNVTWIDSREDAFPAQVAVNIATQVSDSPPEEVAHARAGSYFVVMTHNHSLDQAICEQILRQQHFAYFGMIGSLSKRRQFERRLVARGISGERIAKMACPIGAGAIASKEPMAIAVAVAAELLIEFESAQRSMAGRNHHHLSYSHAR